MSQSKAWKESAAVAMLKLLALLPLRPARALGRWVGRIAWLTARKSRRFALKNIAHCFPSLAPEEQRRLARRSFVESGALIGEVAITWLWPIEKIRQIAISREGLEHLQEAHDAGKGVLVLTPHLGNWELLFPLLSDDFPVAAMYRPPRMQALDDLITSVRQRCGGEMFPASARGVRQTIRALRQGKVTFVLPDQEPAPNAGVFAPFFGQPAWTMTLPARLRQATGCTILFAAVYRRPRGFHVVFEPASFDPDLPTEDFCEHMNARLADLIRHAPEQYQWTYKRFYTQPDGRRQIYLDEPIDARSPDSAEPEG